ALVVHRGCEQSTDDGGGVPDAGLRADSGRPRPVHALLSRVEGVRVDAGRVHQDPCARAAARQARRPVATTVPGRARSLALSGSGRMPGRVPRALRPVAAIPACRTVRRYRAVAAGGRRAGSASRAGAGLPGARMLVAAAWRDPVVPAAL